MLTEYTIYLECDDAVLLVIFIDVILLVYEFPFTDQIIQILRLFWLIMEWLNWRQCNCHIRKSVLSLVNDIKIF